MINHRQFKFPSIYQNVFMIISITSYVIPYICFSILISFVCMEHACLLAYSLTLLVYCSTVRANVVHELTLVHYWFADTTIEGALKLTYLSIALIRQGCM
jgi:hypothetical protein